MDSPEQVDKSLNTIVQRIAASPLFHAALPFAAAIVVATEHKWPSVREFVGGALLLMVNVGKIVSSAMEFVSNSSSASANKPG